MYNTDIFRKADPMRLGMGVLLTMLLACIACGCDREKSPDPPAAPTSEPATRPRTVLDTPEKLLRKIHALASHKRYEEIAPHVLPLRLKTSIGPAPAGEKFTDVRAQLIEGIRDKKKSGDFAYSDEALLAVLTNHLDRIGPVRRDQLESWAAGEDLGRDTTLRETAKTRPAALRCCRISGAFILMMDVAGEYRLLFWRGLNGVLGEPPPTRP